MNEDVYDGTIRDVELMQTGLRILWHPITVESRNDGTWSPEKHSGFPLE